MSTEPNHHEIEARAAARRAIKYAAASGYARGVLRALSHTESLPDDLHTVVGDALDELEQMLDNIS
ncbi:hypothetical protein GCM10027048_27970 [Hymenobacter coalescens]